MVLIKDNKNGRSALLDVVHLGQHPVLKVAYGKPESTSLSTIACSPLVNPSNWRLQWRQHIVYQWLLPTMAFLFLMGGGVMIEKVFLQKPLAQVIK